MESRNFIEGPFGTEFPANGDLQSLLSYDSLKSQDLEIFEQFLRFLQKRPLIVKCSKFCSESFHRLTDRQCYVQMS